MINDYKGVDATPLLATAVPVGDSVAVDATPFESPLAVSAPLNPFSYVPREPSVVDSVRLSVSGQHGIHAVSGRRGQDGFNGGRHGSPGTDATYPTAGENAGRVALHLASAQASSSSFPTPSLGSQLKGAIEIRYTCTGLSSQQPKMNEVIRLPASISSPCLMISAVGGTGGNGGDGGDGGNGGIGRLGEVSPFAL
jgi:hypothetical protein